MPDRSMHDSGLRFASDLRRIREARGVTIEHLYQETKIPQSLLESFEETGLFDHPMFNRVYLRSFVRNYAEVVGIEPDVAVAALEEAVDARYDGGLERRYLSTGAADEAERAVEAEPAADPVPAPRQEPPRQAAPPPGAPERPAPPPVTVAPKPPARERAAPIPSDPAGETPWYAQSPAPGAPLAKPRPRSRRDSSWGGWVGLAVAALVIGGVIWLIVRTVRLPEPPPADTVADTTEQRETPLAAAPAEPVSLPDTLRLTITAEEDRLQGIRVTVDDDVRRPYWLEQGTSRTFRFRERIIVENQLDRMSLQVNDAAYPGDFPDEQGRIVITRDSVRARAASRRG